MNLETLGPWYYYYEVTKYCTGSVTQFSTCDFKRAIGRNIPVPRELFKKIANILFLP